jgi:hypothetical protein
MTATLRSAAVRDAAFSNARMSLEGEAACWGSFLQISK